MPEMGLVVGEENAITILTDEWMAWVKFLHLFGGGSQFAHQRGGGKIC